MKRWLIVAALTFLTSSRAEEKYLKYDDAAIKRFDDELRCRGVVLPSITLLEQPTAKSPPIVTAPAGDFEGFWNQSQFGRPIASFEGIPYAQPPVGPLRFKVAQPLPRLSTPLKATKPGNMCVQMNQSAVANLEVQGDEDCLFINVYVPEKTNRSETERLPVLMYVHGGGFLAGSGLLMQPDVFLDKDILFVTFNYRLGPLGFLTTEDETIPGNLGLKDQLAALRWTKENIASFGGNPDLITVYGESAGAASAEFLTLTPLSRGLIQRVIASSGSANSPWALAPPGEMHKNVRKAAENLSCPAEPSESLLACLQNKTAAEITAVGENFEQFGVKILMPFKPVIEGDKPGAFLPFHPKVLSSSTNRSNDVPLWIGVTSEEGATFSILPLFNNASALHKFDENFLDVIQPMLFLPHDEKNKPKLEVLKRVYFGHGPLQRSQASQGINLLTDYAFLWPAIKSVQYHSKGAKSPAYFYYFTYKGSRKLNEAEGEETEETYGVGHCEDILYLSAYAGQQTAMDVKMSMIYSDLYVNFVRDGVPSTNLLNVTLTPISSGVKDMPYLHIKSPLCMKTKKNLLPERWNLLQTLFEREST